MFNYSVDITSISLRFLNSLISSKLCIYIYIIYTYVYQNTPKDSIYTYMRCRITSNIISSITSISNKRRYFYIYRCSLGTRWYCIAYRDIFVCCRRKFFLVMRMHSWSVIMPVSFRSTYSRALITRCFAVE